MATPTGTRLDQRVAQPVKKTATTKKAAAKSTKATKKATGTSDRSRLGQRVAQPVKKTATTKATKKATARKRAARSIPKRQADTEAPAGWQPQARADQLVRVLGNSTVADLLDVSASQPSRWRNATETPSAKIAPVLVDLDHIVARLQLIWDNEVIADWLQGPNPHLGGARPIDVLRIHGSVPVLEAVEAETAGAYA